MLLIEYLCQVFLCSPQQLPHYLDERHCKCILSLLSFVDVKPTHLKENRTLKIHGLTMQGANQVHAMNGYLGITVQQYLYVKHCKKLVYPLLACAVVQDTVNCKCYYPLELLAVCGK